MGYLVHGRLLMGIEPHPKHQNRLILKLYFEMGWTFGNSSGLKAKNGSPNIVTTNMSIAFMLSAVAVEVDFKSSEISRCPK
jgi:hypothetical protein